MPFFKKMNNAAYNGSSEGAADMYLMRFAEVYYIAAEAAMQLGHGSEAIEYVNTVHRRSDSPEWPSDNIADPGVDDIVWDKLFELCGELHSFYEVRRYGAKWFADNILTPRNTYLDIMHEAGADSFISTFFGSADVRFKDDLESARKSLLCEFPKEELTANAAMSINDKNDFSWER